MIRRHKGEIDEVNFLAAIIEAGFDEDFLEWEFKEVVRELEMLFAEKLIGSEPQAVAESSGDSGFEI